MAGKLQNKVAVVTGGCRGIGLAIAEKFAEEGAFVYVWDYVVPEILELKNPSNFNSIKPIQVDVTSSDSIGKATEIVLNEKGRIDILVNNAGITRDNLLIRMSESEWDSVLNTNLKGAYLCTKAVVKSMMSQRYGKIINISSIVGIIGNAGQSNYSASKAGLIAFTKSIAKELAGRNILANCIAPGYVKTAMTDKLTDEQREAFLRNIPLKRPAEPSDIANVALFLASDESNYITGQVINVDGGLVM